MKEMVVLKKAPQGISGVGVEYGMLLLKLEGVEPGITATRFHTNRPTCR